MRAKRILVLSLYYPPDLSAGSFRTAALVEALIKSGMSPDLEVLTSFPNRYHTYISALEATTDERVDIHRIKLPPHRTGMLDQPRAFGQFALAALRHVSGRKYDVIYATSSRLMTATLGAVIAQRTGAALYLDIRDIFVDTITQVLPGQAAIALKPLFSALERWTIRRAKRVNLVSAGFESYFHVRYPDKPFSVFTNGVDDEFVPSEPGLETLHSTSTGPLRVVYAGNIGEGQGLHTIVPAIAQRLGDRVQFRLIGDGGRRPHLERTLARTAVKNVQVLPPMSRAALIREYSAADVLFLHLNDYEAFKKVLPSKIFEYAASGKPIWAGVSGYPAEFLLREVTNAEVFPPCQIEKALTAFERLKIRDVPRVEFVQKYSRKTIMREMAADILELAGVVRAR